VIALFHQTKIPTVDMKVQVYYKFKRIKNWIFIFIFFPTSTRNGRFFPTSKCRGKVQKIREETLKGLFSRFLIPVAHLFGLM
jgi:hypothetical protein